MSEWITDRKPTAEDMNKHRYVWVTGNDGHVWQMLWDCVTDGTPWMHLARPEPYVKPKRFRARWSEPYVSWVIEHNGNPLPTWLNLCANDKHREAAERIAAIYEEVMP